MLFFNRFSFSLAYRPGPRNVKPDVLSRLFNPEPVAKEPEPILPLTRVVISMTYPWTSSRGSRYLKVVVMDHFSKMVRFIAKVTFHQRNGGGHDEQDFQGSWFP